MSFETTNGLKNAPEVISEGLKIKTFSGGACPRGCAALCPPPLKIISKYHFVPICIFF